MKPIGGHGGGGGGGGGGGVGSHGDQGGYGGTEDKISIPRVNSNSVHESGKEGKKVLKGTLEPSTSLHGPSGFSSSHQLPPLHPSSSKSQLHASQSVGHHSQSLAGPSTNTKESVDLKSTKSTKSSSQHVITEDELRKKLNTKTAFELADEMEAKKKAKLALRSNKLKLSEMMKGMTSDEVFDLFDDDESGFLGFGEFREILPALGININDAKAYRYFKMCDTDGSGEIDRDEFKIALFTCDPSSSSRVGYVPSGLLTPLDAFETFDENGIGHLNEDEFFFALDYLGIKLNESEYEGLFRSIDVNNTECIDYYEFREAFLHSCDLKKELKDRGIVAPMFTKKKDLINELREILDEEEEKERRAMAEARRHKQWIFSMKDKRKYIQRAKWRAYTELRASLDAAGQVYVFGEGSHGQFKSDPTDPSLVSIATKEYQFQEYETILSMWRDRVKPEQLVEKLGKQRRQEKQDEKRYNAQLINSSLPGGGDAALLMKERRIDPYEEAVVSPFLGLTVATNTAALWGRRIHHVAVSENVIFAIATTGEIFTWGGQNFWWHEIQPDSIYQRKWRGDVTPRSQLLMNIQDQPLPPDNENDYDENRKKSPEEYKYECIQIVAKYYNVWETPPNGATRMTYLERELIPKLSYDAIQFALQCRGKEPKDMTMIELIEELSEDITFEKKVLGERAHKAIRELEGQGYDLKKIRKLKRCKKVIQNVQQMWEPLLAIQSERRTKQKQDALTDIEEAKKKKESDFRQYRSRLHENRHQEVSEKDDKIDIHLHGLTPRGPALETPRGPEAGLQIAAGNAHACCIHKSGQLYSWGVGSIGRLGHDSKGRTVNPQQDVPTPKPVESLSNMTIVRVSCGHSHTGAIDSNGDLYMWGSITYGKCGIPNVTKAECYCPHPTKVVIGNSHKIRKLSCGSLHTAVVTEEGQLYVFGCGDGGRLGLGEGKFDSVLPTLVESLAHERISSVSCGNTSTVALTEVRKVSEMFIGGKVYIAGSVNVFGKEYSQFTLLHELIESPIKHASCGYQHTVLVSAKGEMYSWGRNKGTCCGVAPHVHFIEHPTYVQCLFREVKNLALNSKATQSSTHNGRVASLAVDGNTTGTDRTCSSTDCELKAWLEIDLGQYALIDEIRLWNRTDTPRDSVMPSDYFTSRLFPCWVLVGIDPFDKDPNLDISFQNSKAQSVANIKFSENKRVNVWRCPSNTHARFVRVQLDGFNYLSISQLEVMGNWGTSAGCGKVAYVAAGRDVTVAVIRPELSYEKFESCYQRAVYADVGNCNILRQYEAYHPQYDKYNRGTLITKCPICRGTNPCEICLLNKMYTDELHQMEGYAETRRRLNSIEEHFIQEDFSPIPYQPFHRVYRPPKKSLWDSIIIDPVMKIGNLFKKSKVIAPEEEDFLNEYVVPPPEEPKQIVKPEREIVETAPRMEDGDEESIGKSVISLENLKKYFIRRFSFTTSRENSMELNFKDLNDERSGELSNPSEFQQPGQGGRGDGGRGDEVKEKKKKKKVTLSMEIEGNGEGRSSDRHEAKSWRREDRSGRSSPAGTAADRYKVKEEENMNSPSVSISQSSSQTRKKKRSKHRGS